MLNNTSLSPKRIWLINIDDVIGAEHSIKINQNYFYRYLMLANPGDIFITPIPISNSFIQYLRSIKNISSDSKDDILIIELEKISTPYSLVNSLLEDHKALSIIKNKIISSNHNYLLEPFIESSSVNKLVQEFSLPTRSFSPSQQNTNLIDELNDKYNWKRICEFLNIKTIPYYFFTNIEETINYLSLSMNKMFILKKTRSGGGYGNLAGNASYLIDSLLNKSNNSNLIIKDYIIEDYITGNSENDIEILGSLVEITNDDINFLGIDIQRIKNNSWNGATYPYKTNQSISDTIKCPSIKAANYLQKMGVRGYLNIDWLIEHIDKENNINNIYSMECNLRHNGFSFLLNFMSGPNDPTDPNNKITFMPSCPLSNNFSIQSQNIYNLIECINNFFKQNNINFRLYACGPIQNNCLSILTYTSTTYTNNELQIINNQLRNIFDISQISNSDFF
ncbi:MAG: hypothetical protein HQK49_16895 [Oligoflexia bacterium]|nr:hypothetical protein [Oligoflexia bacterium]